MEKKNPNIYQRALDIVNHRINPDIPQGGGGGSSDAVQYIPQELTEAQQMQARKNQGLYYEEDTFGYLLEPTDVVVDEEYGESYISAVPNIVSGETYILVRDGVEYEVTAGLFYGVYPYVGFDPSQEDFPESDIKVCIIVADSEGITMVMESEPGTHTYAIKGTTHITSAIDKKYVMPAFEDYMTLLTPRDEIIFNWDGNIAEAEIAGWHEIRDGSHTGYVKLAGDFPEDEEWIRATMLRYGSIPLEGGSWTKKAEYNGGYLQFFNGCYVYGEWEVVFVLGEGITVRDVEFSHGIWAYIRDRDDEITGYYEVEYPEIEYTIERFAGHRGIGGNSFICCGAGAGSASGDYSVNGGAGCNVSGRYSAAFGSNNEVRGNDNFASGSGNIVTGTQSHAEGSGNEVHGRGAHAEGGNNTINKDLFYAHTEGGYNVAQFDYEHVEGRYNELCDMTAPPVYDYNTTYYPGDIVKQAYSKTWYMCIKQCKGQDPGVENSEYWHEGYNPFVHVVGWGRRASDGTVTRKNIHTLDSLGNAMYTGDVTAKSMIIQSSTPDSTKKFKITVDDTGAITATEVT